MKSRDYKAVFEKGRAAAAGGVVVYILSREASGFRVGLVVSRKVRGAVRRNRIRRLLREVYRIHPTWFVPGYDYVLLGRETAAEANFAIIERSVRRALIRLGVIQK